MLAVTPRLPADVQEDTLIAERAPAEVVSLADFFPRFVVGLLVAWFRRNSAVGSGRWWPEVRRDTGFVTKGLTLLCDRPDINVFLDCVPRQGGVLCHQLAK